MASRQLARFLLDAEVLDSVAEEYTDPEELGAQENTQTLRIVSIFVILATGLLGGIPPLFMKVFRDPDSTSTKLIRAFAAGVIIALALVHIIPEAVEEMAELGGIEYPLGGTTVLFGVALMIFLEHLAHLMHHGDSTAVCKSGEFLGAGDPHPGRGASGATIDGIESGTNTQLVRKPTLKGSSVVAEPSPSPLPAVADSAATSKQLAAISVGMTSHGHVCVSRGSASNWVTASAVEMVGSLRLKVVAYLFELGCIFHSFIIGLSLGVNKTDLTEVRSLLIALAFHQWLESISLASVVVRGGFSRWRGCLMILTYSLTCPVGIAVGMGIAETYDGESERSRGIQGTFNGVSGGMLLYIALVQLVAEDMGRMSPGRDSALIRMGSFAMLFAGAASMCILAIWA